MWTRKTIIGIAVATVAFLALCWFCEGLYTGQFGPMSVREPKCSYEDRLEGDKDCKTKATPKSSPTKGKR